MPVAVVTATIPITIRTFDRELIAQVKARGYDVCVVSSPGPALVQVGEQMGVRVRAVSMTREISPAADLWAMFAWLWVCLRERPSLMISATPKAALLSLVAARLTAVPHRLYAVLGLRLESEHGRRRQILALMEKITSWAATDVVANSPSLAERYRQLALAPARKLRQTRPGSDHGVDSAHFAPRAPDPELARTLGLDRSIPVLGFVGRLTHDKGIDALMEAMAIIKVGGLKAQLLLLGSQDEPDSMTYLQALKSMGENVVAVGQVNDVRPYFALMDVHVLPSLREGFPNVVLEASAMGLPTVTTNATGAIDSVKDGQTGLIVPAQDPAGLAEAITTLVTNPLLASTYGEAARAWVVEDFHPAAVVATLLGFGAPSGPAALLPLRQATDDARA